ncbi:MAG: MurR/RpiR family transcriptional regulator [Parvibaculaceae bacterium]
MSDVTVAERLRRLAPGLASAEQKVARTLFASGMIAGLETVAGLAARSSVSGPTVLRLTAKLGFSRYDDFQRELRDELEERRQSPLSLHAAGRSPLGGTLGKCSSLFSEGVVSSFARLSQGDFERIVDRLCDMRRTILLSGGRVSSLAAQMLYLHLYQMRPGVRMIQPAVQSRRDQLLDVDGRCVLVMFDFRRYEKESVSLARSAREGGAEIVLFTDPWQSPIARFADYVVSAEVASPSAYDSLVPTFALLEAVYTEVFERLKDTALARVARLEGLRTGFEWDADPVVQAQDLGAHG